DLIVDTTQASVDEAVDVVHRSLLAAAGGDSEGPRHGLWLCPRTLFPTRSYSDVRKTAEGLAAAGVTPESVEPSGVQVMIVDGQTYLLDGHARISAAIHNGQALVAGELVATGDEEASLGISARSYVAERSTAELVDAWELAHNLRFSRKRSG
ncbi:MAG: hypothetical protein AAGM22_31725, partial [Acidobacteriota bacterium]